MITVIQTILNSATIWYKSYLIRKAQKENMRAFKLYHKQNNIRPGAIITHNFDSTYELHSPASKVYCAKKSLFVLHNAQTFASYLKEINAKIKWPLPKINNVKDFSEVWNLVFSWFVQVNLTNYAWPIGKPALILDIVWWEELSKKERSFAKSYDRMNGSFCGCVLMAQNELCKANSKFFAKKFAKKQRLLSDTGLVVYKLLIDEEIYWFTINLNAEYQFDYVKLLGFENVLQERNQ